MADKNHIDDMDNLISPFIVQITMSSLSTNVVAETEASNVEIDARITELQNETARITELRNEIASVKAETEVLKMKNTILREVIRRLDMIIPTSCSQQGLY